MLDLVPVAQGFYGFGAADTGDAISEQTNQDNLWLAGQYALQDTGLSENRGTWSAQDAANYVGAFRAFIIGNPDQFTPDTVTMAQAINPSRAADYANSYPDAATNPERIYTAVGDTIGDAMMSVFGPLSQLPANLTRLVGNATQAANNTAQTLGNSPVLTALLIGGVLLWLGSKASRPIRDVKGIFA